MTDTEARQRDEPAWGDALPAAIKSLECALTTAFHAFDDIDRMTMPHRIRVVNEITGATSEAASAAARAGHGAWAAAVVRAAGQRRPTWSSLCGRWDAMLASSLDAIAAA